MREVYDALIQNPAQIEKTLQAGAEKARAIASPFTARLRHAVGLRSLAAMSGGDQAKAAKSTAAPVFKQYREKDGQFYFKLVDAQGRQLLQSSGFSSPREAAAVIQQLQREHGAALAQLEHRLQVTGTPQEVVAALQHFAQNVT